MGVGVEVRVGASEKGANHDDVYEDDYGEGAQDDGDNMSDDDHEDNKDHAKKVKQRTPMEYTIRIYFGRFRIPDNGKNLPPGRNPYLWKNNTK